MLSILVFCLVVAPVIGSFLGVLIVRLPQGRGIVWGRSRCDTCGVALGVRDLVPIASFLGRRGRCRHCGAAIDTLHLQVELAALAVAVWAAGVDGNLRLVVDCVLGWGLLALAWIDLREMILPDLLTLPLLLLGLGWAGLADPDGIGDHAIGAAVGYLAFRLLAFVYRLVRGRDGLGQGDAKLLAASGAWVGWDGLSTVVFLAALIGLALALIEIVRGRRLEATTAVPFGPPLALASWLVWLYQIRL